eukprot:4411528-Pyramimonas_sp.AAC.1
MVWPLGSPKVYAFGLLQDGFQNALRRRLSEARSIGISARMAVKRKGPDALWAMAPLYLMARWIYLLSRAPHRWKIILHVL